MSKTMRIKISEIFGLHLAYTLSSFAGDFLQKNAEAKALKKAKSSLQIEPSDVSNTAVCEQRSLKDAMEDALFLVTAFQ